MSYDSHQIKAKPLNVCSSSKLSRACSKLCEEATRNDAFGRCMSMIVIQFQSMSSCFEECMDLELPYNLKK